jgi:hypothetical protein
MTTIADNLARVREAIDAAARDAGRDGRDVRLIAVSKTQPLSAIREAVAAGQRAFGENQVQEAARKIPELAADTEWHLIGHLQTNKVKFVPALFHWVHTLDSLTLAEKLSAAAQRQGREMHTLIQVNVADDPHKHGVSPEQLPRLLESLLQKQPPMLHLRGLMTIGPHTDEVASRRQCFAELRVLAERCRQEFALREFTELSMGMSDDYPDAIREGATLVRLGSVIFGARHYKTATDAGA